VAQSWSRPVWGFVGLLVAYFAFPVAWPDTIGFSLLGLLLSLAGLFLLGWMLVSELGHQRRGEALRSNQALAMMVMLLAVAFSVAVFLLEQIRPDQFENLDTRLDALYFTLATMATVGYGDVHAVGQAARALVCAVIAFDVLVIASLIRGRTQRQDGQRPDVTEAQR
jgi:uncharacterized membrane protein